MSRLPEEAAYWEALTDRIVGRTARRPSVFASLARFSAPLSVGAAAALVAGLIWLSTSARHAPGGASPTSPYGFALNDPLAAPFVLSAAAPTMATLLATRTSERAP
jgi:hypothetical protein